MSKFVNKIYFVVLSLFFVNLAFAWEVDFSRRTEFNQITDRSLLDKTNENNIALNFTKGIELLDVSSDVVIIITEKGFIPSTVRLKKDNSYKIHVVNVNAKEKNVSFIVDAFTEHHSTFYGVAKGFTLLPKVDGSFTYQCPELGIQGQILVMPSTSERKPASVR